MFSIYLFHLESFPKSIMHYRFMASRAKKKIYDFEKLETFGWWVPVNFHGTKKLLLMVSHDLWARNWKIVFHRGIFRPPRVGNEKVTGSIDEWLVFFWRSLLNGFYCINQFYEDYILKNISSENLNVAQKVCRSCEMCLKRAIYWYFDSVPEVSSCCVIP